MFDDEEHKDSSFSTDDKPLKIKQNSKKNSEVSENSNIIQELEELIRLKIQQGRIEDVVQECADHWFLGKSKPKNPRVKKFVRDRSDKTEAQVKSMISALKPGQTQLKKSKRIKLGRKIGLTESQIYKWYYDTYKSS